MKPVEAFGVAVRAIGLSIVLSGIWSMWSGVLMAAGHVEQVEFLGLGTALGGFFALFVGTWLMADADKIASWTYRKSK